MFFPDDILYIVFNRLSDTDCITAQHSFSACAQTCKQWCTIVLPQLYRRTRCGECGGSEICEHNRQRDSCAYCTSYRCEGCALWLVTKKNIDGKRLCSHCNPKSKRRSLYDAGRDEMKVNAYLCNRYEKAYAIGTYAPFQSCGDTKRPDSVVIIGNMMAIVETDENGHSSYDINCEWAKALQHGQSALETESIRRVCFIRLNSSTWRINGHIKPMLLSDRLKHLGELIDKQVIEQQATYEMYKLFYPCKSEDEPCVQVTQEELEKWFDELSVIDQEVA